MSYILNENLQLFLRLISDSELEFFKLNEMTINFIKEKISELNYNNKTNINFNNILTKIIDYNKFKNDNFHYINNLGFITYNDILKNSIFNDLDIGEIIIKFKVDNIENIKENSNSYKWSKMIDIFEENYKNCDSYPELTKSYTLNEKIVYFNSLIFFSNKFFSNKINYMNKLINKIKKFNQQEYEKNIRKYVNKKDILKNIQSKLKEELNKNIKNIILDTKINSLYIFLNDCFHNFIDKNNLNFLYQFNKNNLILFKNYEIKINICLNLIRKITAFKLNKIGIYTRFILSKNKREILMVLKPQFELLIQKAEKVKAPKELELGKIDLLSFEPIDKYNRPIKIKDYIFEEIIKVKNSMNKENFEEKIKESTLNKNWLPNGFNKDSISKLKIKILALNDFSLLKLIKETKTSYNNLTGHLYHKLKLSNIVKENQIKNDYINKKKSWINFITYVNLINFWFKLSKKYEWNDWYKTNEGMIYRLIFEKSLYETNKSYKSKFRYNKLKTLWNKFGEKKYFSPYYNFNANLIEYFKSYEINELNDRSIFNHMEKIKLTNMILNDLINIKNLIKLGFMKDYYPLHDRYIIYGENKLEIFKPILKNININQEEQINKKEIFEFINQLKINDNLEDFIGKPLKNLLGFNIFKPLKINIKIIKNYFGENIFLYFNFLKFYLISIFWFSLIGIIFFVFFRLYESVNEFVFRILIFALGSLLIIFIVFFINTWNKIKKKNYIKLNQLEKTIDNKINFQIKGYYFKNIGNNNINYNKISNFKFFIFIFLNYIMSFIFLTGTSFLIILTLILINNNNNNTNLFIKYYPYFINSISIIFLNKLNLYFNIFISKYEIHFNKSSYEKLMIIKLAIISFINNNLTFLILIFYSPNIQNDVYNIGTCNGSTQNSKIFNCYKKIEFSISFYYVTYILINNLEKILYFLKIKIIKKNFNKILKNNNKWKKINEKIFLEDSKDNFYYLFNLDFDPIIIKYIKILENLIFITIYGVFQPLLFIFSFIDNWISIHFFKYKLVYYYKRPISKYLLNIKNFDLVFNFYIFFSIIYYSSLNSFLFNGFTNSNLLDEILLNILLFISLFIIIKYIILFFIGDIPKNIKIFNERYKIILNKILNNITKKYLNLSKAGIWIDRPKFNKNN